MAEVKIIINGKERFEEVEIDLAQISDLNEFKKHLLN